jgi:Na+/pantothenate symporter
LKLGELRVDKYFTSPLGVTAAIALAIAIYCGIDAYKWNKRGLPKLYKFFLLEGELKLTLYTTALVAANLSVGNFIVFVAIWGYQYGLAGIVCFIANIILNAVGFALFFPRFRGYIENHDNNGSVHDYISRAYTHAPHTRRAKAIRLTASLVTVVCLTLAIVFELSLAVQLLAPSDQFERIRYFAGLAFLIGLFTSYGGFRTLVVSDRANAAVLTIAVVALCGVMWYFWSRTPGAPAISMSINWVDFKNLGWAKAISICVIGFGWMLVGMDQWQRTCASRSYPVAFGGVRIYVPIVSLFAIAFALWGVFDHSVMPLIVNGQESEKLFGEKNPLLDIIALPVGSEFAHALISFIIAGLVFAAISTTNTFLTVCGSSFASDVIVSTVTKRPLRRLGPISNEFYVGIARAIIVAMVLLILACFVALTIFGLLSDPFRFFFIAYSVQFALLPCIMMSILPNEVRPTSSAALWSLGVGFIASLTLGFGAWLLSQVRAESILWFAPSDWLPLAPVITIGLGFLPLLGSATWRWLSPLWRGSQLARRWDSVWQMLRWGG